MENQDPWEPTFPVGYTLSPKSAYVGGVSTRPTHGLAYPAIWPTSYTLAAPTLAAAAATVAPTLKSESARRSSGSCGISDGTGGGGGNSGRVIGGIGGGGKGAEERLNSMVYNNAYVEVRWGLFRHAGAMRLITCKASLAGVKIPTSPVETNCKACPALHIKGMCNMGYGNAADHVVHTLEQDLPLWGWAVREMPEITAPVSPVV